MEVETIPAPSVVKPRAIKRRFQEREVNVINRALKNYPTMSDRRIAELVKATLMNDFKIDRKVKAIENKVWRIRTDYDPNSKEKKPPKAKKEAGDLILDTQVVNGQEKENINKANFVIEMALGLSAGDKIRIAKALFMSL